MTIPACASRHTTSVRSTVSAAQTAQTGSQGAGAGPAAVIPNTVLVSWQSGSVIQIYATSAVQVREYMCQGFQGTKLTYKGE